MVSKSGSLLPKMPSEHEFAEAIGAALRKDLGASRRATKSIMMWADVSDRTARAWLHGVHSPGGLHLVALSAHSRQVMELFLSLAGQRECLVSLDLMAAEKELEQALDHVRHVRTNH